MHAAHDLEPLKDSWTISTAIESMPYNFLMKTSDLVVIPQLLFGLSKGICNIGFIPLVLPTYAQIITPLSVP